MRWRTRSRTACCEPDASRADRAGREPGRPAVWRLPGSLPCVRIARFTTGGDPRYGVVEGAADTGPAGSEDERVLAVVEGDPLYRPVTFTGERVPMADARLLAPVIPRSKVVAVGRNYAEHAAEMGGDVPPEPLCFLKPNTSVVGPGEPISYPRQSSEVHFEGELAVVIGRLCRDVPSERVGEVVYGYTCANDVTARDLQKKDGQWWRAKGFDTFCPVGPWVVTDLDVSDLAIATTVNGERRQDARTSQMVYDVATLVAHVSSAMTLLPGDLLLTGTPAGVGRLAVGDEVAVGIEGIGTLRNRVVARG
jgi:2-keto-4-pentenoate hydratase/2-oxohepta-3-ene-1,7-dioic acid hydratase in catechol pathway